MIKNIFRVFNVILVISLTTLACGAPAVYPTTQPTKKPIPPTPRPTATRLKIPTREPAHDLYAGFTGDSEISFVILHKSGEKLGLTEDFQSNTTGAIWTSRTEEPLVIYSDGNGLPSKLVAGENVLLYSNYTNTTVDVTIVYPDGRREVFRSQIDVERLNKISNLFTPSHTLVAYSLPNSLDPQQDFFLGVAKATLYLASAATCIGGASLGVGALPIIAYVANACRGFILTTAVEVGKDFNLDIANIETLNDRLDVWGCQNLLDPLDCMIAAVTEMERPKREADQTVKEIKAAPTQCTKKYC